MKKVEPPIFPANSLTLIYLFLLTLQMALPHKAMSQACNRQQDSLALVQLYNAMNGPSWSLAWNLAQPMNNWFGVSLNPLGCVQKLEVLNGADGLLPDLQLPHIQELRLGHFDVETTTNTLPNFTGMPNLKKLNLGVNLTGTIPDFSHLPLLEELVLTNPLATPIGITGEVPDFSHIPALKSLAITQNSPSAIPDFTKLPNLEYLDLSRSKINEIPDFSMLGNLKELVLSNNPLAEGVPDFTNLPALERLIIIDSDMDGSFPVFSHLPSLKFLRLGGSSLASLDAEADIFGPIPDYDFPALEELRITFVETNSIIPNFSKMPNLKKLEITGRYLSGTLPDFAHLPKLTDLHIGGYLDFIFPAVTEIGGSVPDFTNLPQLRNLDLCFNRFTGEPTNFSNLPQAKKIDLSYNQLSGTAPDFSNLPNVDDIFLNINTLTAISPQLSTPGKVKVSFNWLTFEDLMPVLPELGTYADQDTIPVQPLYLTNGSGNLEIDLLFDENITGSTYTWHKNGQLLGTSQTNNFEFLPGTYDSDDILQVYVVNPGVPNLTLITEQFPVMEINATTEPFDKDGIEIRPNPASAQVEIKLNNNWPKPLSLRLHNSIGQSVWAAQTASDSIVVPTENLEEGVYFLSVTTGESGVTKKIIVQ